MFTHNNYSDSLSDSRHAMLTRMRRSLESPHMLWIIVGLGIALRTIWAIRRPAAAIGEAANVALALADGRGFADAYHVGQGPTAHILPTQPLLAGGVYALLGPHSVSAEAVLFALATIFTVGSYLLLWRGFSRLGTPRWARNLALAYVCLFSPYLADEVVSFRVWDGGLAGLLAAIMLNLLVDLDHDPAAASSRRYRLLALVGAITFFVQPLIGIACYVATVVLAVRRLGLMSSGSFALTSVASLAILLVPWTMRNALVMGTPILLRSNAGLELSISMYPGALRPGPNPKETFNSRLREVHPLQSAQAYQRMKQAGGEVRYATMLGDQAQAWMRAHPADVIRLAFRHLRETYVPPTWITHLENERFVLVRTLLVDTAGILGLFGIALALIWRRQCWIYPAVITLLPGLMFALFQPIPRYDYLFFGLLTFAAADLVASIVDRQMTRRRPITG